MLFRSPLSLHFSLLPLAQYIAGLPTTMLTLNGLISDMTDYHSLLDTYKFKVDAELRLEKQIYFQFLFFHFLDCRQFTVPMKFFFLFFFSVLLYYYLLFSPSLSKKLFFLEGNVSLFFSSFLFLFLFFYFPVHP